MDNATISNILVSMGVTIATGAFQKAENPARAIDDILTLVGFENVHQWAQAKRFKSLSYDQDFKLKLAKDIKEIVLEDLKEPPLAIAGPALDTAKYYLEEEGLRDMFAKLVASSMDKSKDDLIHPSFVQILKELSPIDANNLIDIKQLVNADGYAPIVGYYIGDNLTDKPIKHLINHIFINSNERSELGSQSSSIENLSRLGLIEFDYNAHMPENYYNHLLNNNFINDRNMELIKDSQRIITKLGIIRLSAFGVRFCKVCLS